MGLYSRKAPTGSAPCRAGTRGARRRRSPRKKLLRGGVALDVRTRSFTNKAVVGPARRRAACGSRCRTDGQTDRQTGGRGDALWSVHGQTNDQSGRQVPARQCVSAHFPAPRCATPRRRHLLRWPFTDTLRGLRGPSREGPTKRLVVRRWADRGRRHAAARQVGFYWGSSRCPPALALGPWGLYSIASSGPMRQSMALRDL